MSVTISGYTMYEDKEFTFYLVDFILTLVPKDNHIPHLVKYKQVRVPYLEGETTDGHNICFFNLLFYGGMISQNLTTAIPAYIIGKNNLQHLDFSSFSAITFYGEIVDKYFNPSAKFDHNKSSCNFEEGSSVRILKPFSKVDVSYNVEPGLVLYLGVINPSMPNLSIHSLGEMQSLLRLQNATCWGLDDVLPLYRRVLNLFSFFNFRSNITFDKVTLSTLEDGKYYAVGELFVAREFPCTDLYRGYTITHLDIEEKIVDLYNFLEKNGKLLCFIPENDAASRVVDYDSYMITCSVFEKVYCLKYPKRVLKIISPFQLEVRSRIISALEDIVASSEGEFLTEANAYLTGFIHKDEMSLRDRFAYCIDQNKAILETVFPTIKLTQAEISKISGDFSHQRNAFDHGNFERILAISVSPYTFAIILIYIMILKQLKVDDPTITRVVKRMFRSYYHQDSN